MAVEAENICFENMGFGPYAMSSAQDCFLGSVLGIEDGYCFQELEHLHPVADSYDNLVASSSSSSSSFLSCCGSLPAEVAQSLSCEFERQRAEMDLFLQLENSRLRRSILQEETRQQAVIMQKYEPRIKNLLLQKDQELALARNKTRELQDFLKGAEMEARAWEKTAREKEAIVSDLNNRLNQAKERDSSFPNGGAVSFCDSSSTGGERSSEKMACKLCQFRSSRVVFFPCRHLCCCKLCEPLSGHCPVCETVKEASLDVFLG